MTKTEGREALLPCPFCGGEAELFKVPGGAIWPIASHAADCPVRPGDQRYYLTEAEAITAWNTREDGPGAREMRPIWATVRAVETVPIDHPFSDEQTDPIWRIEIDGYCADFDYQEAANNFADAINGLVRAALNAGAMGDG